LGGVAKLDPSNAAAVLTILGVFIAIPHIVTCLIKEFLDLPKSFTLKQLCTSLVLSSVDSKGTVCIFKCACIVKDLSRSDILISQSLVSIAILEQALREPDNILSEEEDKKSAQVLKSWIAKTITPLLDSDGLDGTSEGLYSQPSSSSYAC
jgi:hypothetical protein